MSWALRNLTGAACLVEDVALQRIPAEGPLILVSNHINFLEVPLLYTRLEPRRIAGFAKAEHWKNPPMRFLFETYGAIPLHRGEADAPAIEQALAALRAGWIFGMAPEGTRSGHGQLQRGRPGVVLLAARSGAPILPMAHYGGEVIWRNLARLRRTPFHIVVGNPFLLDEVASKGGREIRQAAADEIMYQIAALLPPAYRGVYANLQQATERYLVFPPGSASNLASAAGT
jgi:1-acyl-sn-glycerol-3-phosphate acyltransferase